MPHACEGKIGCHNCLNFLQILESKSDAFLKAVEEGATPNVFYAIKDLSEFIKAFKKGE